jgi:hypothetical protein
VSEEVVEVVEGARYSSAETFFAAVHEALDDGPSTLRGREFELEVPGMRLIVEADEGQDVIDVLDWMKGEERYWSADEQLWLVFAEAWCRARGYRTTLAVTYHRWVPFYWLSLLWLRVVQRMMREKTKDEMFELGRERRDD